MDIFAISLELSLGGDWSALKFFGVLLAVVYFLFTIFAGLKSASHRLVNILWPATLGVVALIGLVLLFQVRDSGDDTVRLSAETDSLSVETDQSDLEAESGQDDSGTGSFSHSRSYEHDHDGIGPHTHHHD